MPTPYKLSMGAAGVLAGLSAVSGTAAVAVDQGEGNPLWWWILSLVLAIEALSIACWRIVRPWYEARKLWEQTSKYQKRQEWNATHAWVGTGFRLDLRGPGPAFFVYMCELKRRGEALAYIATLGPRGQTPAPAASYAVFYPDDFVASDGSPPPTAHHQESQGCYMQVWWALDPVTSQNVFVAEECFRRLGSGAHDAKKERRCIEKCPHAE
jgi:hypothetical protein